MLPKFKDAAACSYCRSPDLNSSQFRSSAVESSNISNYTIQLEFRKSEIRCPCLKPLLLTTSTEVGTGVRLVMGGHAIVVLLPVSVTGVAFL
jgi:hypothetical protein